MHTLKRNIRTALINKNIDRDNIGNFTHLLLYEFLKKIIYQVPATISER